jgi:hypothetical protein
MAVQFAAQLTAQVEPSAPMIITRRAPAVALQPLDALLDDQAANVLVVRFHISSSRDRRMGMGSARRACV